MRETVFDRAIDAMGVVFMLLMLATLVGIPVVVVYTYRDSVRIEKVQNQRQQACLDAGLTPVSYEGNVTCSRDPNLVDPALLGQKGRGQ